jgi:molybdopterin-guanine dinucleotide biosynthesis protein A
MNDPLATTAEKDHQGALPDVNGTNVTAVILAGGAGRRLHGADKPLHPYRNRPLIEHVLARIVPQVQDVLISANRNLAVYAGYGRVVTDQLPGYAGPLAGVTAALRLVNAPWVLVCPGDAPALPTDLLAGLADAVRRAAPAQPRLAVAADGHRVQPLPMLLHTSLAAALARYLGDGARSVHGWLAAVGHVTAAFPDPLAFRSLNRAEDFQADVQSVICDCR